MRFEHFPVCLFSIFFWLTRKHKTEIHFEVKNNSFPSFVLFNRALGLNADIYFLRN